MQTVQAIIDRNGNVRLLETVTLSASRRAIVTILEEERLADLSETALVSEHVLARDWLRPEEDEAWSHLQLVQ
jgi:hypothetical protein